MSKESSIRNRNRGRALPRKWGRLGTNPAARREEERFRPQQNSLARAAVPILLSGGAGAAAPASAPSLLGNQTSQQISRTAIANQLSVFGCGQRLRCEICG